MEDIGCFPVFSTSFVTIPMTRLWPVLIGFASFIYASLTIRAFLKTRRQFSNILSDSGSNLSMSRYFRLMALAGTDMAFTIPLALYFLINSLIVVPPTPWISWEDVHANVHEVWTYSREEMLSSAPGMMISLDLNRWALPACAFIFFAYFGFSSEATDRYKKIFWRVVAPLGFKPPSPQPQRQSMSLARRITALFTISDRDDITIPPITHTAFDAPHSIAEIAADLDAKSSVSPVQSPAEEKMRDLESQT
ncbi:a-factor receptor [Ceratobasidium sp. UAMH 11750]|nr:a-factor receptor [Ceratobasidium sp. UAMH 11750]